MVLTGGRGEHIPVLRERLVMELAWLGADLDSATNQRGGPHLTTPDSWLQVLMMATDEERVLVRYTRDFLAPRPVPAV